MSLNRKNIYQLEVGSVTELKQVAEKIQNQVHGKTCILLEGDLAAGKTTLVQKFCELYSLPSISSPTFSLHHVYENDRIQIHHFDLYRLNSSDEVETSGLWDVLSSSSGIVFIEWPSRISENDIPADWLLFAIEISILSESKRSVKLSRLLS